MKAWVFEYLEQVSDSFHGGGGLLVIAENKRAARRLLETNPDVVVEEDDWSNATMLRVTEDEPERLWVFPDAGCC